MNPPNPESLILTSEAIKAWRLGKRVQYRNVCDAPIESEWTDTLKPSWFLDKCEYRPKPEPATRPWSNPDDVPGPVCWVRFAGDDSVSYFVTTVGNAGVRIYDASLQSWDTLRIMEHSADRKTWHPCMVTE